ncbi:type II toxin-antitoxin system HicA family toxin [Aliidiomarina celeris]|uniref:type II toxin-antitoxin system HicA family toxin n=1 Tax=Aliidiomarina celeris TaxID=2249428 RepID=UPI000DEA0074|nr:type II toxin-antitoxin system HicA family toxin [Aliidiomarina celeris]
MPHNKNNERLNFLIHKRSPLLHRVNLNSRLLSTREFIKRCKQYDEIKFKRSGKGSHQIWTGPSGRTVSIPAAKDLPIGTLKSILDELGIRSSVHEFSRGS